jgi:transposase InsO family protein
VNIHKNARLTPARRVALARRAEAPGAHLSALAREFGVSRQTVAKWRTRWATDRAALLPDRSSRPHHCPHRLARHRRRQIERWRRRRWSSCRMASVLQLPIAAVVREQRRLGLARLPRLEPPHPILRYEWPRAGDLLHLDVKKLGKIGLVGHRIHGDRTRRTRGLGWEYLHVAIDDCTRVPYAEVLADETGPTTVGFLTRALAGYRARGIRVRRLLTDNGGNYRSHDFRAAVAQHGLQHHRTRPYTPRTNGKAERFIRTLLAEWAYAQAYRTSAHRTRMLPKFLYYFTRQRRHYGLHGQTPAQRLAQVL